ncbi:MAG TPA: two-component regulator propeller domain-containing protein, partial [Chryseosolibacter sp.]|nr:two-component regulator propeller domain-containing protein [Chryseosolibacter sp.]
MKKLITSALLCVWAMALAAQDGSYFLTHHSPAEQNYDNVCFDIAQDKNGIMYFAVKAGVLEYDGREWDLIPGAGAVYALNRNDSGEIFWVGAKGFGKIGLNNHGFKEIQYLSDSTVTNVFQTLAIGERVYFLSENKIFLYRGGKSKAEMLVSGNAQSMFTGMFELFGVVYVQTERNTIFKLENDKLVYVNLNFSGNVLFNSRLDDTYLLGTSDNRIYSLGKDLVVKQLIIDDQPYADANVIINGTWVNTNLLALGTLRGGVMLINPWTGKRDQIIDYSTGLPDNEVFSLVGDANQNIWVGHEYGFTQISPSLPFRSFSYFSGLAGNMLCAYSHRGNVYVGTSLGLFKLDKDEIYDEVVTWVELEPSSYPNTASGNSADGSDAEAKESTRSKRRGFLNFLKRNRDKQSHGNDDVDESESSAGEKRQKRVDRVLRSSQFVFKKVQGIHAKITHLVEMNGKLVAAGLEGVFEVEDVKSQVILQSPARYVYASDKLSSVIVSTYNDEIWSLTLSESGWQHRTLINGLGDQIDYIFEGADNEWWLCGLDRVYQLQLNADGIHRLETIRLPNPNFEKTVGVQWDKNIFFV